MSVLDLPTHPLRAADDAALQAALAGLERTQCDERVMIVRAKLGVGDSRAETASLDVVHRDDGNGGEYLVHADCAGGPWFGGWDRRHLDRVAVLADEGECVTLGLGVGDPSAAAAVLVECARQLWGDGALLVWCATAEAG
jgi:hypothetical protein